jgi:uncharacterized membrane protein YdfJ with MMPL/SSD domain
MIARLAGFIADHPKRVLGLALAVALAAGAFGGSVAERLFPYGAKDASTDSAKADKAIERATRADSDAGIVALVRTGAPPRSAKARAKVDSVARVLRADREVARVSTFARTGQRALVSRDGRSQLITVNFKPVNDKVQQDAAKRLTDRLGHRPGVQLGGFAAASADVNAQVEHDLRRAEMLAFPLLFLLSLLFFRSLVAALLPLLVGGLAIVGTFAVLRLANGMTEVSVFALNLTTALGLGLAIDYALFMVARYREEIARVGAGREALMRTMATAGRTVLFSSLTVSAALFSLLVFPQRFLYSMGLGGGLVALVAASVALVVLPAVLALLGTRVNSLAPRRLQRAADRDARPAQSGAWYRLSRFVMRRPGPVAVVSATVLLVAGIPFLGIKFNTVDPSVLPNGATPRVVQTELGRDFPPHSTEPSLVVARTRDAAAVRSYAARLKRLPDAASVPPPQRVGPGTWLVRVNANVDPIGGAGQQLVHRIRGEARPFPAHVGGRGAEFVDLKHSLSGHLPWAFLIVAAATMLILFLMTGSVVLPFKALVMNVLTLSATFGLLVLVFQDGRFEGLLDYTGQGALEISMPVLLFAVAFGLSTDYGVFLLSRIKEARDNGASDRESVAIGLERTGRIVTAAALLFSVALGAFATSEIIFIKENGVGTALAVLIDASIVRALLVPALMELLGKWNWWAPKPLRALHRRIGITETPGAPAEGTA